MGFMEYYSKYRDISHVNILNHTCFIFSIVHIQQQKYHGIFPLVIQHCANWKITMEILRR